MTEQESMLQRAKQFEAFKDNAAAVAAYQDYANKYPYDYEGWWGLTRHVDWEKWISGQQSGSNALPACCERALATADETQKLEIQKYIQQQMNAHRTAAESKRAEHEDSVAFCRSEVQRVQAEIEKAEEKKRPLENKLSRLGDKLRPKIFGWRYWVVMLVIQIIYGWLSFVPDITEYNELIQQNGSSVESSKMLTKMLADYLPFVVVMPIILAIVWFIVRKIQQNRLFRKMNVLERKIAEIEASIQGKRHFLNDVRNGVVEMEEEYRSSTSDHIYLS